MAGTSNCRSEKASPSSSLSNISITVADGGAILAERATAVGAETEGSALALGVVTTACAGLDTNFQKQQHENAQISIRISPNGNIQVILTNQQKKKRK